MNQEKVDRSCETCEFNTGIVCMGYGERTDNEGETYGMSIEETKNMFPNGCNDWEISFAEYQNI